MTPVRPLTSAERRSFDHVSHRTRHRALVASIPWLPRGFAGLTLGRFVLLARPQPTDGSSTLIAHELVHVEQWDQRGRIGFLRWYLGDFARELRIRRSWMPSYQAIRAEVEARERTRTWWNQAKGPAAPRR